MYQRKRQLHYFEFEEMCAKSSAQFFNANCKHSAEYNGIQCTPDIVSYIVLLHCVVITLFFFGCCLLWFDLLTVFYTCPMYYLLQFKLFRFARIFFYVWLHYALTNSFFFFLFFRLLVMTYFSTLCKFDCFSYKKKLSPKSSQRPYSTHVFHPTLYAFGYTIEL